MKKASLHCTASTSLLLLLVTILILYGCSAATPNYPVIYQLDFEHPEAYIGWRVGAPGIDPLWLENTQDGRYVFEYQSGFLQNLDFQLTDIEATVDTYFQSENPMDVSLGCRTSVEGGYFFIINNDQHWLILKNIQGQSVPLAEGDSNQISTGENRLLIHCVGPQLILQVNGTQISEVTDADITLGGIQLGYNSFAAGSGSFDNLLVYDLAEPTPTVPTSTPLPDTLTPTPSQTPTTTPTLTPSPTPDGQLFSDTFNDGATPFTDWIIHEVTDMRHFSFPGEVTFELPLNGTGQAIDGGDGQTIYAIYERLIEGEEWVIEEQMQFVGAGNAMHSVVCGYSTAGWYEIGITSNGHWQVEVVQGEPGTYAHQIIGEGESDVITTTTNQLQASCTNNQIHFDVNGTRIAEFEDASITTGNMVGFTYNDDEANGISMEMTEFQVLIPDGQKAIELTLSRDSFYFAWRFWAVALGYPQNIRSLVASIYEIENASGSANLTLTTPGRWIAILPQEFPHNVQLEADITAEHGTGVGIMCRWSESNGGYALWYINEYVVTSPFALDEEGNPIYYGAEAEYATNIWQDLLFTSTEHHVVARCWGDLVELYIDGQRVSYHQVSGFPMERDRNKQGLMIGLLAVTNDQYGPVFTFDNIILSTGDILLTPVP